MATQKRAIFAQLGERVAWVCVQEVVIEVLSPQFTVNWRCMNFTEEPSQPLLLDDLSLSLAFLPIIAHEVCSSTDTTFCLLLQ
ncbi:hypothetical protein NPIL_427251 [Nephila pilipes]|uniref:Uncharacterized protein n=1 Tax=Nephila pilipes TaxID=299642 RepID=A0A8X6TU43_NEPPI|nr:hypothetical protein NPIL_216441 [Nephila pilipes]GFT71600.1 hypothetical protein NPIL_427251 [Nephila pilipes]